MQDELHNKLAHLKEYIKDLGSVTIGFSSGVDSTFLLKVAHEIEDNVMAITVQSGSFPKRELNEAIVFAKKKISVMCGPDQVDEMKIEGSSRNPLNRC